MKIQAIIGIISVLSLGTAGLPAQDPNQVEALKAQLQQLQQRFEQIRLEQTRQIEALQKQVEALQAERPLKPATQPAAPADAKPVTVPTAAPEAAVKQPWTPTDPIRVLGNSQNFLNLSLDALVAAGSSTARDVDKLQLGGHDPTQRGFTLQNVEAVFEGAVDPYFRGQANLIANLDAHGDSNFELEEAFAETTSLPWNLQVKAGQYLTEFGRLNPTHPHAWAFVDQPLINGRFLGGDGLRNPGARISWLAPLPFYSEFLFGVQNSQGETAFSYRNEHAGEPLYGRLAASRRLKTFTDLLLVPRYVASFELSATHTLVAGASAAFGANASGADTRTSIYGLDLFWKWKPNNHHGGFPFVSWQTEAMLRHYEAGAFNWDLNADGVRDPNEQDANGDGVSDLLPRERLVDYGLYSQLAWGLRKGWVAALRGDFVTGKRAQYEQLYGRDADRAERWRLSPSLTWFPTEFSKLRLQYNYDDRQNLGSDHSVWLQLEFLLGAHAAHKF